MNEAMLRNLTPDELERHLWITEPYSPTHLAVLAVIEEFEEGAEFIDQAGINSEARQIKENVEGMKKGINDAFGRLNEFSVVMADALENLSITASSISAGANDIQCSLNL